MFALFYFTLTTLPNQYIQLEFLAVHLGVQFNFLSKLVIPLLSAGKSARKSPYSHIMGKHSLPIPGNPQQTLLKSSRVVTEIMRWDGTTTNVEECRFKFKDITEIHILFLK